MKVTPFILFIILLVVLVIAILFRNILPLYSAEGFVSFSNNINTLHPVVIPPYSTTSSTVVKLYDNLFFDTLNANLIEVDSQPMGNTTTSNNTVLNEVYVTVRNGTTSTSSYKTPNSSQESKTGSINRSLQSWTYVSKSRNTSTYQVIYVAWELETFIHIVQLTNPIKNIASFYFTPTTDNSYMYPVDKNIVLTTSINLNDRAPEYAIDSLYSGNTQVYNLSSTFAYDPYSGNVIYHTHRSTGTTVTDRSGGVITTPVVSTQNTITNVGFIPWLLPDDAGRMLLYVPNGLNTLLIMLSLDSATSSKFIIGQVAGFRGTILSYDPNSTEVKNTNETPCDRNEGTNEQETIVPPSTGPNSDYYKWLAYWNTISNSSNKMDYTDYLLKTQVVPPVCPQCPNCPNCEKDGACTNCGGQGGSGTKTADGQSVVNTPGTNLTVAGPGVFATTADPNTIGGAITTTGTGVVSGAGGIVQTAGGVVNNAVDVTGGLLYGAGSGATNLLKSAGSGIKDILSQPYQQSGQGWYNNRGSQGWVNEPTGNMNGNVPSQQTPGTQSSSSNYSNYSYYGTLPTRSGNYLPLTADFSAFSR